MRAGKGAKVKFQWMVYRFCHNNQKFLNFGLSYRVGHRGRWRRRKRMPGLPAIALRRRRMVWGGAAARLLPIPIMVLPSKLS
jgi:hypothetical protein